MLELIVLIVVAFIVYLVGMTLTGSYVLALIAALLVLLLGAGVVRGRW